MESLVIYFFENIPGGVSLPNVGLPIRKLCYFEPKYVNNLMFYHYILICLNAYDIYSVEYKIFHKTGRKMAK